MYRILIFLIAITFSTVVSAQSECIEGDARIWQNTWTSCEVGINPNNARDAGHWIQYEFEEAVLLTTSHIWNTNEVGKTQQGFKEVIFDYSLDGQTWTSLDTITLPIGTGEAVYGGFVGPDFGGVEAKYVLLTALSNHGDDDCYGIAEVKFNMRPQEIERVVRNDDDDDEEEGCYSPDNIAVMHINAYEVELIWEEVEIAQEYVVYLRIEGEEAIQEFYTDETELFIDELQPETTYEYAIIAICEEGESQVEEIYNFTTIADSEICQAPERSAVFIGDGTTALLSWNEVFEAEEYQIRIRAETTSIWQRQTIDGNWLELNDLNFETEYVYQVRARCEGGWTAYSETFYFETWEEDDDEDDANPSAMQLMLYPNPASDFTRVLYPSDKQGLLLIEVHNITGKLVWTSTQASDEGRNSYLISLKSFPSGTYTVRITAEEESCTQRLIVAR